MEQLVQFIQQYLQQGMSTEDILNLVTSQGVSEEEATQAIQLAITPQQPQSFKVGGTKYGFIKKYSELSKLSFGGDITDTGERADSTNKFLQAIQNNAQQAIINNKAEEIYEDVNSGKAKWGLFKREPQIPNFNFPFYMAPQFNQPQMFPYYHPGMFMQQPVSNNNMSQSYPHPSNITVYKTGLFGRPKRYSISWEGAFGQQPVNTQVNPTPVVNQESNKSIQKITLPEGYDPNAVEQTTSNTQTSNTSEKANGNTSNNNTTTKSNTSTNRTKSSEQKEVVKPQEIDVNTANMLKFSEMYGSGKPQVNNNQKTETTKAVKETNKPEENNPKFDLSGKEFSTNNRTFVVRNGETYLKNKQTGKVTKITTSEFDKELKKIEKDYGVTLPIDKFDKGGTAMMNMMKNYYSQMGVPNQQLLNYKGSWIQPTSGVPFTPGQMYDPKYEVTKTGILGRPKRYSISWKSSPGQTNFNTQSNNVTSTSNPKITSEINPGKQVEGNPTNVMGNWSDPFTNNSVDQDFGNSKLPMSVEQPKSDYSIENIENWNYPNPVENSREPVNRLPYKNVTGNFDNQEQEISPSYHPNNPELVSQDEYNMYEPAVNLYPVNTLPYSETEEVYNPFNLGNPNWMNNLILNRYPEQQNYNKGSYSSPKKHTTSTTRTNRYSEPTYENSTWHQGPHLDYNPNYDGKEGKSRPDKLQRVIDNKRKSTIDPNNRMFSPPFKTKQEFDHWRKLLETNPKDAERYYNHHNNLSTKKYGGLHMFIANNGMEIPRLDLKKVTEIEQPELEQQKQIIPTEYTQEGKINNVYGINTGVAINGFNKFANMAAQSLELGDFAQNQRFAMDNLTADNLYGKNYRRDRGDYDTNSGLFRPDQMGQKFYKKGGVVEMTEEELEQFLKNGGKVEYL